MVELSSLTLEQLRNIAGGSCIKGYSKMTKANLILAIRAHKLAGRVRKAPAPKKKGRPKGALGKTKKGLQKLGVIF